MTDCRNIILIDDEQALRVSTAQTLDLAGFAVRAFDSGEAGLKEIARGWGDVLITDVRMAGLDGMDVLRQAVKMDPELPVVLITGHGGVAMAVQAIREGAYDFLEKPFSGDHLIEVVRRASEKRTLIRQLRQLREDLAGRAGFAMVGRAPSIERVRQIIRGVADTDADVLMIGETGAGKELVARALHFQSARAGHNFVALNCGALPAEIFESELFGHHAGAFTGAAKTRVGRIEFAHKGTLFLDEIESMPMVLQVKLLRVLQERMVEPLGSNAQIPIDVRVVAATKTNLTELIANGTFREDLYYRLNVVVISIPPLRERKEDIPLLFQHFVALAATRYGRVPKPVNATILECLMAQSWPGNVRELRNYADRFVLGVDDFDTGQDLHARSLGERVDSFEKMVIEKAFLDRGGDITAVAEDLNIPKKTLYDKLRRHGIRRSDFVPSKTP